MKSILVSGILASLLFVDGSLFLTAPIGHAQTVLIATTSAPGSDFATAVQTGIQALAFNPVAQIEQQQIQSQDYKSTWDEFGVNVMVGGATPSTEISNQIVSDITQSAEAAQDYDQQEANYLQTQQLTPEQVQSTEQSVGVDLPPGEQINTNPSIDANPDVNLSGADVSVPENNAPSSETGTDNVNISSSTYETSMGTSTNEVNPFSSTTTSITPIAGLEIAQSVDNTMPQTGETINYTLIISALGPDTSTEVTATDALPTGITFVDATSSVGAYDSSTGTWSIGDMAASSTATLVITAMVDASDTVGQSISNTATVSESSTETNLNQDKASSSAAITVAEGDNVIFDAILQSEQSQSTTPTEITTTTSSGVVPSDTTPPAP